MNINKLKNNVEKKQRKIEKEAFKLFCEDIIADWLRNIAISKAKHDELVQRFNNLTEENLLKEFNSDNLVNMISNRDNYIKKVKENK